MEKDALMFFVLSKTVATLLLPSNFLILLGLLGVALLFTRFKRAGRRLMAVSLVLLAFIGLFPVGGLLTHVLENRFPSWNPARGAPDGIIVLGGALDSALSVVRHAPQLSAQAERLTAIAKLAREYPQARIVYSGGNAALFPHAPPEAEFALPLWESFGIARDRITLETRSRNTYENALFSKRLLKPKPGARWLLVTSAEHMPRAIGCFRRVGFPVEAYPVDWTTWPRLHVRSFLPRLDVAGNLSMLEGALHEWIGLVAYRLTGRIDSFFPGPAPAQ